MRRRRCLQCLRRCRVTMFTPTLYASQHAYVRVAYVIVYNSQRHMNIRPPRLYVTRHVNMDTHTTVITLETLSFFFHIFISWIIFQFHNIFSYSSLHIINYYSVFIFRYIALGQLIQSFHWDILLTSRIVVVSFSSILPYFISLPLWLWISGLNILPYHILHLARFFLHITSYFLQWPFNNF